MTLSRKSIKYHGSRIFALIFGLTLHLVATPALAQPSQSLLLSDDIISQTQQLSVREQLNVISNINSQRSYEAKALIESLEQQHSQQPLANIDALRLTLLHCFNLLEFGEFNQAITLAKQGEMKARQFKYDTARPYFMQCQADAHQSLGNTLQEQQLTEEALRLARRYSEKQAIVNSLYARSRQNTSLENYNQSIEDLRLALAIFDEAQNQFQHWFLLPKSYLQAEISNVFFSMGDLQEALHFAKLTYQDPSAFGKLNFAFAINLARINIVLDNREQVLYYLNMAESENDKNSAQRDLAIGNAILAGIHLYVGDFDIAEKLALSSITSMTKYQEPLYVMRIKRTLAKVYFAQHKDIQALSLLNEIIEQATELKQFSDLEEFNQIISQYYAEQKQFESAYQFQVQRFDAAKQAAAKLNNAHFMQYKARITAQSEASTIPEKPLNNINQNLTIAVLIILFLSVGLVLFLVRKPKHLNIEEQEESQQQCIDNMLNSAKQGHYQLTLLLLNINHINTMDLAFIIPRLKHTLREQDKLFRHNTDEIIIILPHTSPIGAARVATQIEQVLSEWKTALKVNIGIAGLQQLDTFDVLVKKAVINQLNKIKSQETSYSHDEN
ncbi:MULTISPECIES: diguanylate cyclase [Shewanella]|uniref:diguanylate cyclase domain-containing protein n=2 Tax=Shewanellaceae TaxID=267890 RepID=UPI001D2C39A0|nr:MULTISPECIES: diguanylate cyclase [Shewanella]NCQ46860.1 diguanylate cyclase [Shewanella frigidimarina]NCO73145.1 diguanylate cyclase [Shewanella vesiculosa]NCP36254.1 diguanylate cyclase [Shewanella vesiculosa]NCP69575.1 diguanylate cyclase [Shewanella vesiculosa]NCP73918.1 diguanylate cyclase [Shewanella vesiculosa]